MYPIFSIDLYLYLGLFMAFGCRDTPPEGLESVKNFRLSKYLGTWYEIARLPHRFEKGLENVTAHYALREDGYVQVTNRGYNPKKQRQSEAKGKAKFAHGDSNRGHLKVSFLGPFYANYVIFYLEEDYSIALVCGSSKKYLWILSRSPKLPLEKLQQYVDMAKAKGFDTEKLIYPDQQTFSPDAS